MTFSSAASEKTVGGKNAPRQVEKEEKLGSISDGDGFVDDVILPKIVNFQIICDFNIEG